MAEQTKKQKLERHRSALRTERDSFIPHWKDLSKHIQPRRGRFFVDDVNKGDKRHQAIINSTTTTSLRRLRSGVMSGLMSPSRPWFRYETAFDPDMMEFGPVAQWLYRFEQAVTRVFRQSNLYQQTPVMVGEMGLFATGCMTHVDDFEDVARFYTHTVGSYLIDIDDRLVVNVLVREFKWTVAQIVSRYGLANVSRSVRSAWDAGNYTSRFDVVHFIGPNPDYQPNSPWARHKRFHSTHYEPAGESNKFLLESGFDEFPAYCPRWEVTEDDAYGTDCPGMTALGDTKGLQVKEKRKAQGIDKMVNPPLKGPASLKRIAVSSLPGALNAYENGTSNDGLSAVYQVNLPIGEMRQDISDDVRRIKEAFYNDLFRAISDLEGVQPQNELFLTQVNQERLLELGPMMEQFQGDFQDRLHTRTFNQIVRASNFWRGGPMLVPPPPPELRGRPLRADYIGPMAMAAKAIATSAIDRTAGFAGALLKQGFAGAADKLNADQAIDEYAKALGAPPGMIVPDEDVARIRQERLAREQAAMTAEGAQAGSQAVKNLAEAGAKLRQ